MTTTVEQLRRLILSANDLRQLRPDWPAYLIEDYLNILENTILLAESIDDIDTSLEISTILIDSDPYEATMTDEIIWVDASAEEITINLKSASEVKGERGGRAYQIQKIDASDNEVIINPFGAELINGDSTFALLKQIEYIKPSSTGTGWLF